MATHSERQFRLFLISFVDADIVPWKIETVGTSVRKRLFFHWTSITRVADALGKRWDRTNKGHEETTSNEYTPERHFPTSYAMAIAEICKIMSENHSRTEGTSLVAYAFFYLFSHRFYFQKYTISVHNLDWEWTEMFHCAWTSLKSGKNLPLFHKYRQRTRLSTANGISIKILQPPIGSSVNWF